MWSPSGNRLAFVRRRSGHRQIFLCDGDGSSVRRLTRDPAQASDPTWSPNGMRLAFTSTRDGHPEVYAIDVDGRDERRLTDDPTGASQPDWSPEGKRIAFTTRRAGTLDIWVISFRPRRLIGSRCDGRLARPAAGPRGATWYCCVLSGGETVGVPATGVMATVPASSTAGSSGAIGRAPQLARTPFAISRRGASVASAAVAVTNVERALPRPRVNAIAPPVGAQEGKRSVAPPLVSGRAPDPRR